MDEIFNINSLAHGNGVISAALTINADSSIFNGHFPGQPVVPGAYMLDIVRQVLEKALGRDLRLAKASQLKFVGMINPLETSEVLLEVGYKDLEGKIVVSGKLMDGDRVCLKFQGMYNGTRAWIAK